MVGGVGHTGGLTNPRPWRGSCRAGYSNTGGPPLPRKRAPFTKKRFSSLPPPIRGFEEVQEEDVQTEISMVEKEPKAARGGC